MNLPLFLIGSVTLAADAPFRTSVLNLCLACGVSYTDFRSDAEGNISFRLPLAAARRLQKACAGRDIPIRRLDVRGIPFFLWRLCRRAGLVAGAVCAVVLAVLSTRFVWDVRVTGNTRLTEAEVLSELSACGFGVGTYIPGVRTEVLENRVLMQTDRLSWISVYLDGTVARVQVIESDPEESQPKEPARPANLVAARDGQIEYLELYRGNNLVKVGQAVKKGDLLVSGIYDSQTVGIRFTRAAGNVYARTERQFRIEIPYAYEKKVYAAPVTEKITLHFFDFSTEIFKSTGNRNGECDIIESETDAERWGLSSLPVRLTVRRAYPFTAEPAEHSENEAWELAYTELERQLAAFADGAVLLRKTIVPTVTGTGVVLDCTVTCIENIAVQAEFEITD